MDCARAWRIFAALAGLVAACAHPAAARPSPLAGPVEARVLRVIDGDTIEVAAHVWIGQEVTTAVRLAGVDAPELFRPKCAAERARAERAKEFAAEFFGAGPARLFDVRHGKYAGRVVARMENAAGADLGAALVAAGLAAEGKRSWCAQS